MTNQTPKERTPVEVLSTLMSSYVILTYNLRGFHWNVTGPSFMELHQFFQEQYELTDEYIDRVAERIRQLNFLAPHRMVFFVKNSLIDEALISGDQKEMLMHNYSAQSILAKYCQDSFNALTAMKDDISANMVLGFAESHSKYAWMTSRYFTHDNGTK